MQFSTLPNTNHETHYVRVAPHVRTQKQLTLVYIGRHYDSTGLDLESMGSGIIAENIVEAKTAMLSAQLSQQNLDGIILDVAYNEKELAELHSFLSSNNLRLPIIYNEYHLRSVQANYEMIDDVVDLAKSHFDIHSKISFLRKVKEYRKKPAPVAVFKPRMRQPEQWVKRLLDIAVSSILLIVLAPLFLLIALIIKLESKGPIFYNAKRAGRGFKIFSFYKFRTMEVNADKKVDALLHLNQYNTNGSGPKFFKISNDPRITRVGKFLRNTSLDEIPQLFNVLKGDMSLVGNRPLPLYEAATLTTNDFVERFMAPAGITGLWQIKKRGKADMSTEERISLDISYARNSNLLYDLWIMANTPGALFQKNSV
jgi:lipopolysaccharide/colanic/teichoic acid biosynthesis glycosyltransferase